MLAALKSWFSPNLHQEKAHTLYAELVAKARNAEFYADLQVPDTLDGRFDMIILQVFLATQKLADNLALTRALHEAFFADMDRSLREMGSSDTGVGKRVKKMSQAFYGRMQAYTDAIGDEHKMKEVLKRNVYRDKEVSEASLNTLFAQIANR